MVGVALLRSEAVGDAITAISERLKNWDKSDIYNLTTSKAMIRHCEGLRRLPLLDEELEVYKDIEKVRDRCVYSLINAPF